MKLFPDHFREALASLTVFRKILGDPLIKALCDLLEADRCSPAAVDGYCRFAAEIYSRPDASLSAYVRDLLLFCPNPVASLMGEKKPVPEAVKASAEREISILQELSEITPEKLQERIDFPAPLPRWSVEKFDLLNEFRLQMENITKKGSGIFAKYRAFRLSGREIVPIEYPDPVRLSELLGYEREKEQIIGNTRALISGLPAANILLTGDAGTGKSSTVKAVVNELWQEGLRILELKKEQLHDLPDLLSELNRNPLRFIVFVDDLSFSQNDDNFSALKAILEGTVSAKAQNVAIYATSNRRHLIKESFSDRDGDDIHRGDTMQETVSLSERFGLHITFSRPDKATYLSIVEHLCRQYGVDFDETDAERFALSRASRSARAARQYVDSLVSAKG